MPQRSFTLLLLTVLLFISSITFLPKLVLQVKKPPVTQNQVAPEKPKADFLPRLYIQGNQIVRSDNHQPVRLIGVVSDYFRFADPLAPDPALRGIQRQIDQTLELKNYGINLVGFYLSDFKKIKENIAELDTHLEFASSEGLYVYLMPVARDFTGEPALGLPSTGNHETLTSMLAFLSARYAKYDNILFGIGAEAETETFESWRQKQLTLIPVIRQYNSEAIVLISSYPSQNIEQYEASPLQIDNILYFGGLYVGRNDTTYNNNPNYHETILNNLFKQVGLDIPVLIGEFGGNWGGDFSSQHDFSLIARELAYFEEKGASYAMYRFSASYENDKLALFDTEGKLTPRGELFISALSRNK